MLASPSLTLGQLAESLGLTFQGKADLSLTHLCGLQDLAPGGLAYLANLKELANLPTPAGVFRSQGASLDELPPFEGALLVPMGVQASGRNLLFSPDPLASHCAAAALLHPAPEPWSGVHPRATVDETAQLGPGVCLQAGVVVEAGAKVGARTVVHANSVIGHGAVVGEDCLIMAQVSIGHHCQVGDRVIVHSGAVLGADGYGFYQRPQGDGYESFKIPQVGIVLVESDCEIGANTCIDRARFTVTRIGQGSKLDNLIHIAHNVELGPHSLITAQSGIAGSTKTGANLMMGGQSGVRDNLTLGKGVKLLARTLVTVNAKDNEELAGMPSRPMQEWRRTEALIQGLTGLVERLKELETFAKSVGFQKKKK